MNLLFHVGELSISDVESILEFTQTKTSRHMAYLKNAGMVGSRQQDQWVFYSLREESLNMVSQIFRFLEKDQMLLDDLKTYETLKANRELADSKIQAKGYQL